MADKLKVGSTNTHTVKGLRDTDLATTDPDAYPLDATVELEALIDSLDVNVPGTEGIAMPYISGIGKNSIYRGATPHTAAIVAGETYTRRIVATLVDGSVRRFDEQVTAEA